MPFLKKRSLVLAKVEVTEGVDPVPTPAANAILVSNPDVKPIADLLTRDFDRPSLSPLPHVIGLKEVEVTFGTELKGSGTANAGGASDIPEIDPLLQAAGFAVTLNAESGGGAGDGDIQYDPASDSLKSVTLYVYMDGILHKITGCRGSFSFNAEAGQFGTFEFTFRGKYLAPTDAVIPAGSVFNAQTPPPFLNANLSLGGYTPILQAFTFDMANDLQRREDANSLEGVIGFVIGGRDTQGSINPEAVTEATHPFWDDFDKGTQKAFSATFGSVAGNKIDITAPKVQAREMNWGDRNTVRVYDIPITMGQDSGDDEVKFKFY